MYACGFVLSFWSQIMRPIFNHPKLLTCSVNLCFEMWGSDSTDEKYAVAE
jgi:hypothetical protein